MVQVCTPEQMRSFRIDVKPFPTLTNKTSVMRCKIATGQNVNPARLKVCTPSAMMYFKVEDAGKTFGWAACKSSMRQGVNVARLTVCTPA
jgi:hypothetical protein